MVNWRILSYQYDLTAAMIDGMISEMSVILLLLQECKNARQRTTYVTHSLITFYDNYIRPTADLR